MFIPSRNRRALRIQSSNDGTRRKGLGALALPQQPPEYPFHLCECDNLPANVTEPRFRDLANRGSTTALLEPQQFANFVQAEPQLLRALDEANPLNHGGRIAPDAATTVRDGEQTPALVVAYRFDTHVCGSGQASNCNGNSSIPRQFFYGSTLGSYFGHHLTPYLGTESRLAAVSKICH
jgi:hypothetical protein